MPARKFTRLPITRQLLTRIFSKIHVSTERFYKGVPCWEWVPPLNSKGYGHFSYDGRHGMAHRVIYQIFVAEVSPELECDHLCRRPSCVNPVHIEPVTPRINQLRGESFAAVNAKKTHCINGHKFTPENIIHTKTGRNCRICQYAANKRNTDNQERYRKLMSLPYDHPRRVKHRERVKRANQKLKTRSLE